jgi:superfamily II RNA helicase
VVLQSRFEDPADAQGIIARGPEALQSQFASGFGMVLNLLHTRSLEEARAFVQRSFNNYLGARHPPIIAIVIQCSRQKQWATLPGVLLGWQALLQGLVWPLLMP